MSERDEKRGAPGCFIMGVVGFMLPVLYVLSIGPAGWTAKNYPATEKTLEVVYSPVLSLCAAFKPFGDAVYWYMDLCGGGS